MEIDIDWQFSGNRQYGQNCNGGIFRRTQELRHTPATAADKSQSEIKRRNHRQNHRRNLDRQPTSEGAGLQRVQRRGPGQRRILIGRRHGYDTLVLSAL